MSREIEWNLFNLCDLFSDAFKRAQAEQAYFDLENERWKIIATRPVQNLIRRRDATTSEVLRASYEKQFDEIVPESPRQPPRVDVEVMEKGYDWKSPETYETTGVNGTDFDFFTISPGGPNKTLWMNPNASAEFVLVKTSQYKGWRMIEVEGGCRGLHVAVFGGRYEWKKHSPHFI